MRSVAVGARAVLCFCLAFSNIAFAQEAKKRLTVLGSRILTVRLLGW